MLKRWRQFKIRDRLIFLVLFAVLLPTIVLLVTQYYSLRDLREKTRITFETSLRQTAAEVDDTLEAQISEVGYDKLRAFDQIDAGVWNSFQVKEKLVKVLDGDESIETSFVLFTESNDLSYTAIASRVTGYRETKSDKTPEDAFFNSPEEESITVSFVAVIQSSVVARNPYFFVQSRCEKCPLNASGQHGEKFYIYRPLSDPRDIRRLKFAGIGLKQDFIVSELIPNAIKTVNTNDGSNQVGAAVFGVFDENGRLVYSDLEGAANLSDFEVQIPLRKSLSRWSLAAGYRDSKIENLSTTYFRRNLLLMLLVISLLIVGILLILRVAAKEIELAAAKSAFVSNVSHELKTPLSLIRLFAETLESGRVKTPEKAQDYYRIISSETRRLTQLINNILDFAAIEAGRKEYKFKPQNLNEIVKNVIENYRYVLETAGFEIRSNFDDQMPPVLVDCDAISQAVLNLLNNACKYSGEEKFVEVKTELRRDNQAAIIVTDHGIGIAPGEQEKIFDKFYRSGGANDVHNAKGSGLGLSLVRHIVYAHEGRVIVSSVLKRGSTFTILLPFETKKR